MEAPRSAGAAGDDLAAGDLVDGRYRIEGPLGRGGAGRVHRAVDLGHGQPVALKVLELLRDTADLARFQREAETAAALGSLPGFVAIHATGQHRGRPWYAMQLVEGEPLSAILGRGPLQATTLATLLARVARAIEAAHRRGVIHRDLKPGNILVRSSDGVPLVADLGLALVRGHQRLSVTGEVLGTPAYMAPEQLGERSGVGPASDVYALGAILYHGLTGSPPFQGAPVALLAAVAHAPPAPPSSRGVPVPPALEDLCLRALAKDPAGRPPSALAFAEELEAWLAGSSSLGGGARGRRGRALAVGASLLALAALATLPRLLGGPAAPLGSQEDAGLERLAGWDGLDCPTGCARSDHEHCLSSWCMGLGPGPLPDALGTALGERLARLRELRTRLAPGPELRRADALLRRWEPLASYLAALADPAAPAPAGGESVGLLGAALLRAREGQEPGAIPAGLPDALRPASEFLRALQEAVREGPDRLPEPTTPLGRELVAGAVGRCYRERARRLLEGDSPARRAQLRALLEHPAATATLAALPAVRAELLDEAPERMTRDTGSARTAWLLTRCPPQGDSPHAPARLLDAIERESVRLTSQGVSFLLGNSADFERLVQLEDLRHALGGTPSPLAIDLMISNMRTTKTSAGAARLEARPVASFVRLNGRLDDGEDLHDLAGLLQPQLDTLVEMEAEWPPSQAVAFLRLSLVAHDTHTPRWIETLAEPASRAEIRRLLGPVLQPHPWGRDLPPHQEADAWLVLADLEQAEGHAAAAAAALDRLDACAQGVANLLVRGAARRAWLLQADDPDWSRRLALWDQCSAQLRAMRRSGLRSPWLGALQDPARDLTRALIEAGTACLRAKRPAEAEGRAREALQVARERIGLPPGRALSGRDEREGACLDALRLLLEALLASDRPAQAEEQLRQVQDVIGGVEICPGLGTAALGALRLTGKQPALASRIEAALDRSRAPRAPARPR